MTSQGGRERALANVHRWRILFILYALALTTGTHWPRLEIDVGEIPQPDKILHWLAFGGLTYLLWKTRWIGSLLVVGLITLGWAAIDEFSQNLPGLGRTATTIDFYAGATGVVTAMLGILLLSRFDRAQVKEEQEQEGFQRHAWTVTLLTLLSRATGLLRDASLSRVFGAGMLMDAFFFAFMIPNLFRRLFGEGALSAAFLPEYARMQKTDARTARGVATLTIAGLIIVLGVITIVGEAFLFVLSRGESSSPAIRLMMIMLPYMPLVCLVAMFGAMLQVHKRFGPTAAAPIVLNVCIIAATLFGGHMIVDDESQRAHHVSLVALAVIVAGGIQVGWSMFALRHVRWWDIAAHKADTARTSFKRIVQQAGPMILGLGVLQLNTFFDGIIASYPTAIGSTILGYDYPLDEGAMATVSFAQRLYQFPLGVFGIAIATAIFPALSRLADHRDAFTETLRKGLRLVIFIGLPASFGLILVRTPLVAVILQGGDFELDDTRRVAFVLLGYAPAVWAYSMTHVLTRAYYALQDSKTPVRVAISVVVLNIALNCTLIWTPLREAGLAWSTAICSIVQVAALLMLLKKRIGFSISGEVRASWLKTILIAALMAVIVGLVDMGMPQQDVDSSWMQWFLALAALVVTGKLVVISGALSLRMPELKWAVGRT